MALFNGGLFSAGLLAGGLFEAIKDVVVPDAVVRETAGSGSGYGGRRGGRRRVIVDPLVEKNDLVEQQQLENELVLLRIL